MKIRNDLIRIKSKNKVYDLQNMIMDEYLKRFANFQVSEQNINKTFLARKMRYCLLKFDTPFENLSENSEIHNQDFDVAVLSNINYTQELGKKQIIMEYQYNDFNTFFVYSQNSTTEDLSSYYGRKITAIGFNNLILNDTSYETKFPVCAVLDTSNYDIYFEENQDFVITRRDIITSDAEFYSKSKLIKGPAHLAPYGTPQIIDQPNIYEDSSHTSWQSFNDSGYGILYSIGLSSHPDYIDEEFIIGEDVNLQVVGNEINITGLENYLATDSPLFCDNNLYPSSDLYPVKTNYKYVIFKYKVWQMVHSGTYENVISTITDTGLYYYEAVPIDKFGEINLKITYERG